MTKFNTLFAYICLLVVKKQNKFLKVKRLLFYSVSRCRLAFRRLIFSKPFPFNWNSGSIRTIKSSIKVNHIRFRRDFPKEPQRLNPNKYKVALMNHPLSPKVQSGKTSPLTLCSELYCDKIVKIIEIICPNNSFQKAQLVRVPACRTL